MDAFISMGSFACLLTKATRAAIIIHHVEGAKWFFCDRFYGVPRWIMPFFKVFGFSIERLQLMALALLFRGKIITVSESTARVLRHLGFGRERIEVISEAITAVPLERLVTSLPKEQPFTVLTIGMRKAKRPQHVLRAFESFQEKHPSAQLWLAGWGGMEQELQNYITRHQIKHVKFWGRVTDHQRDELLQRAQVLCTSPLREGWGLVVTEANAMGTPVIGYDVPGLRDALAFQNGWLCAPTPRHMAEKLEEAFELWSSNPAGYEQLRQRCLASAKNFSFDRTYAQFAALLPTAQ
jgi:glycosyltransferase involved in cell wall biosynthesis